MTRGALIFAFDNGSIDYTGLAAWTADNIHRHLDIPVAVVTDRQDISKWFDHVIHANKQSGNSRFFPDFGDAIPWHNQNRADCYDLSPWDETLVLDADYIVASDQLKALFDIGQDFLAHRWASDITGLNDFKEANHFGQHNMPMWWATVMYFRRGETARLIFDSMKMIRDHWQHYCDLYRCRRISFRNDYALGIAINLVNGHVQPRGIPWSLVSLSPNHRLKCLSQDEYRIDFVDGENRPKWIQVQGQDFHAMGKRDLGDIVANQI